MAQTLPNSSILHASTVAFGGRAMLITGASGAGKSGLALRLIALGAALISDDRTEVVATPEGLLARCPAPAIRGKIEARGIGILRAPVVESAPVALVVDLDGRETDRLPPRRKITIMGFSLPLVLHVQDDHFPAALMLYLKSERLD